jgi:hypothetical protein
MEFEMPSLGDDEQVCNGLNMRIDLLKFFETRLCGSHLFGHLYLCFVLLADCYIISELLFLCVNLSFVHSRSMRFVKTRPLRSILKKIPPKIWRKTIPFLLKLKKTEGHLAHSRNLKRKVLFELQN